MNRTFTLLTGVLLTIAASFVGLVIIPEWQLDPMAPVEAPDGTMQPQEPTGSVAEGREIYSELGCIYCHSQQVRPDDFGTDHQRGWGDRQTHPVDHIHDEPPLLGTMRTGPDLANIANRQPSRDWHHIHLFNPETTSPGSVMPPHRFLYRQVPRDEGEAPDDALNLPDEFADPDYWWVPTERAEALVDYLLSLDHSYEIDEEQLPHTSEEP